MMPQFGYLTLVRRWIHLQTSLFRHRSVRVSSQRCCCRPMLESLEDRTLLSSAASSPPTWMPLGPAPITQAQNVRPFGQSDSIDTGAINAIAIDPLHSNNAFVATVNGGIWHTTDFNDPNPHWTTTTDHLPSLAISSIAFSPVNDKVIYAGTGSFSAAGFTGGAAVGLYKSTDGGKTWSEVGGNTLDGLRIQRVIPTSLNGGQTIFVATLDASSGKGGVYRSDDGGQTWKRLSGKNGLPAGDATDLVENPANPNQFFAAVIAGEKTGIYRLDLGATKNTTWTNVSGNIDPTVLDDAQRILLSMSPAGTNPLWVGTITSDGFLNKIYRGVTDPRTKKVAWTVVGPDGKAPDVLRQAQGTYHYSMVADPAQDNLVYVGGDTGDSPPFAGLLARGNSTTNEWTAISDFYPQDEKDPHPGTVIPIQDPNIDTAPHADSRQMVFDGNNIVEADDGGIYLLQNPRGGIGQTPTWSPRNGNIADTELYSVAINNHGSSKPNAITVLGGAQDNGVPARDTKRVWTDLFGGDGVVVQVASDGMEYLEVADFQAAERISKTGQMSDVLARVNGARQVSEGGKPVYPTLYDFYRRLNERPPFKTVFRVNAGDPDLMLIGTKDGALFYSTNSGDTVTSLGGLNKDGTEALPVKVLDGSKTTDMTGTVTAMAFGNAKEIFATYVGTDSGNIYYTADIAGQGDVFSRTNFSRVAGGEEPRDIVMDPKNSTTAYAVTSKGVFMTTDGQNWKAITGNINKLVTPGGWEGTGLGSIALIKGSGGAKDVLLVGGLGGVWELVGPSSSSTQAVWKPYGANMPNVFVDSLQYDPTTNVVVAGTLGRGAWEMMNVTKTI